MVVLHIRTCSWFIYESTCINVFISVEVSIITTSSLIITYPLAAYYANDIRQTTCWQTIIRFTGISITFSNRLFHLRAVISVDIAVKHCASRVPYCSCGCVCHRGLAASQTVLLTHGDSVATVAPGFASCAQTADKKVAGEILFMYSSITCCHSCILHIHVIYYVYATTDLSFS